VSEPKRYQPVVQCVEPSYQAQMIEPKVMEFSEGEYVLHSDYARLKGEVERLTNAGNQSIAVGIKLREMVGDHHWSLEFDRVRIEWNAAKGGQK